MSDYISRQAAIEVAKAHWYKPDIAKALEQLPSADVPPWIPCSERLPEEGEPFEVLCCDVHGNQLIAYPFSSEEANTGYCAESEGCYLYDCIAWMPLPEPYKGSDEK